MNDRAISLLEKYEIEVTGTRKGRGAILCETDRGLLVFKEYCGNPEHLKMQKELLRRIAENSSLRTEELLEDKEGELSVRDYDGTRYLLKTYRDGRECNVRDREDCLQAATVLARLHLCTQDGIPDMEPEAYVIGREYEKRNRELRKIRKFLKERSQKTWFEISLKSCFDRFLEQAQAAAEGWKSYAPLSECSGQRGICHGDYTYHNLLADPEGWFLINFERCICDDPVRDLNLLLRKILEKSGWSVALGKELLEVYERIRPLPALSKIDLYYRLSYPEKFWKIANFYYNSGKAWIPGRNQEKLEKLLAQEKEKKEFLEKVFCVS